MAKVITANDLSTGNVVFHAADGSWVAAIADAVTFENAQAAEEALQRANEDVKQARVIDPSLAETGPDNEGRPKMTMRDSIRAYGPTIDFRATGRKVA